MLEMHAVVNVFSQEHQDASWGKGSSVAGAGGCETCCWFLASDLPKLRRSLT